MLFFFRYLLNLYPASYRREYGEEMLGVLIEVHSDVQRKSSPARAISCAREAAGLLRGALREHARAIFFPEGFRFDPQRRLTMRSEYKFPKATVGLMTVILAVVMVAIEKAKAISESVPASSTSVGPIQPMHFSIVAALELLAVLCVGGALVWAALFALHRSGAQRFSDLKPSATPRPNNLSTHL
jgi:hypothetical protein